MSKKRPILKGLTKKNTSEIEKFQNETIRPIIKVQHDLLIGSLVNYFENKKIDFSNVSPEIQNTILKNILERDNSFKFLVLGIIIGQFNHIEFSFYLNYKSEFNRRIKQIILKRYMDSKIEINKNRYN